MKRKYTLKPTVVSSSDPVYTPRTDVAKFPVIDLRTQCPPVLDQKQLGSCTANSIAGIIQFLQMKEGLTNWTPSRLFIYYNERSLEGSVWYDSGASITDSVNVVNQNGVCPETMWTYSDDPIKFRLPPWASCYQNATLHKALKYAAVNQSLNDMKSVVIDGYPVAIGFSVYSSFESDQTAKTGIVPMPGPNDSLLGGHAVHIVGYDDSKQWFICKNSWGTSWGDKGYFYIPYQYLTDPNLASDFWMIQLTN